MTENEKLIKERDYALYLYNEEGKANFNLQNKIYELEQELTHFKEHLNWLDEAFGECMNDEYTFRDTEKEKFIPVAVSLKDFNKQFLKDIEK